MRSAICSANCFISALALLAAACAGSRPLPVAPAAAPPLALLPFVNLTGAKVPSRELQAALESALRARGIQVLSGDAVDAFLERHRIRYTGGLGRESAAAAGAELGVAGVLITTLTAYDAVVPPKEAIAMRLVAADAAASILWIDEAARAGDESPGLFQLGVVRDIKSLQERLLAELSVSLARSLSGEPVAKPCAGGKRFGPKELFRSRALELEASPSVAILPFVNDATQRQAGDLLALEFARQFQASGRFRVVEPGILREEMLQFRIVLEGGVSLDTARVLLELLQADYVLAGTVSEYEDPAGSPPKAHFTTMLLDRRNSEVVWESTSYNEGDDGVFFFDAGLVSTGADLICRMARSAVDSILEQPKRLPPPLRLAPHAR